MGKKNVVYGRTCVYNCNYHIVFTTKYRRKVLIPKIEEKLKELIHVIAIEKGFEVAMVEVGEHNSLN